jgi:hypothetical protein
MMSAYFGARLGLRSQAPTPDKTPAEIAREIIADRFDREWDPDEFLDEEQVAPALRAYEEVLDIAIRFSAQAPDEESSSAAVIAQDEDEVIESDALAEADVISKPSDSAIETLLARVHRGELVISPEWQRSYVWKSKRQKRFVESLLIGLPIPAILTWRNQQTFKEYVIDGRQRLETLVRFCSTKEALEKLGIHDRPFKTFGANEPLFAPGKPLNDVAGKRFAQFPESRQRQLLANTLPSVRFERLTRKQLYQVFERYNTGGVQLQAQEIRNAVYQDQALHQVLWRISGESLAVGFASTDEKEMVEDLRSVMGNKTARYGVYDFLGRVLAFTYFHSRHVKENYTRTVAAATIDFMDTFEDGDHTRISADLVRAYVSTKKWYGDMALVRPSATKWSFHAFLATVQLATTHHLLGRIGDASITEESVQNAIKRFWSEFALNDPAENPELPVGIAHEKQNSTLFWGAQKRWLSLLEAELGLQPVQPETTNAP